MYVNMLCSVCKITFFLKYNIFSLFSILRIPLIFHFISLWVIKSYPVLFTIGLGNSGQPDSWWGATWFLPADGNLIFLELLKPARHAKARGWGISAGASHGPHAEDAGGYGAAHRTDGWATEDHYSNAGTGFDGTVTCTRVFSHTDAAKCQARPTITCLFLLWEARTFQERLSEAPGWPCQEDTVTSGANSANPASTCTSNPITRGRSSRGLGFSVEPHVSSSTLLQQREGSGVDDQLITRTVGKQPLMETVIEGIKVPCLIDTGSQMSLVSESLFNTHLEPVLGTSHHGVEWLRLTAANGLTIPYIGIADLDVEVGGVLV